MKLIGRKIEQEELRRLSLSEQPEFAVVYGLRRVGKTFLIRSFFKDNFTFYTTGIARGSCIHSCKVISCLQTIIV